MLKEMLLQSITYFTKFYFNADIQVQISITFTIHYNSGVRIPYHGKYFTFIYFSLTFYYIYLLANFALIAVYKHNIKKLTSQIKVST